MVLGSNLPAYGTAGDGLLELVNVAGDAADKTPEGAAEVEAPFAFMSISASRLLVWVAFTSFCI